jgi:c-di-GMP-binding flagellar brake protein YcgR
MSGIENRQLPRANVVWRAAYLIAVGKYAPLKVINVSEGGIGAMTEARMNMGQQLQLVLEIPHPDGSPRWAQAPIKGIVVHTILSGDAYKIGIRFVEIDPTHKGLIKAWVTKLNSPIT